MGALKNRLIETVLLSTTTYVLIEKLDIFLTMHSYPKAAIRKVKYELIHQERVKVNRFVQN